MTPRELTAFNKLACEGLLNRMEELLEAGELTPSLTLIAVSIIDREDEFAQLSADLQDRYGTALIA